MGKGGLIHPTDKGLTEYPWEEIARHTDRSDKWIVIDKYVYDVTNWSRRHPGGEKIISGYAGQDASEAWYAFHVDKVLVNKYMAALRIGRVKDSPDKALAGKDRTPTLVEDFREVRTIAEKSGWFNPSILFYVLTFVYIVALELGGWAIFYTYGTGWLPTICAVFLIAISQTQAGWSQHDFGHLSVFKKSRFNVWMHMVMMNFMKGWSREWWSFRHYNHHSKTNILNKDPDVTLAPIFLIGKTLATEYGRKKLKSMPYLSQHKYWHFVLPPLLMSIYYPLETQYFCINRKRWLEMLMTFSFYLRWYLMFGSMLGVGGVVALFLAARFIESHWFVWVSQSNHIPKEVGYDKDEDWVRMHLHATCNVEQSWFNDWFTGHLNFQIEHHLFPTMPRHNLHKVAPLVRSLCEKHGLDYQCKPMLKAMGDIVDVLKESGEAWREAYNM